MSILGSISNTINKQIVKTLTRDVKKAMDQLPEDEEHEVHTLRLSLSRGTSLERHGSTSPRSPVTRISSFSSEPAHSDDGFDPRNQEDLTALQTVIRGRKNSISTLQRKNEERDEVYLQLKDISPKRFGELHHVDEQIVAVQKWIKELDADMDSNLNFNEATGGMKMINKLGKFKQLALKFLALAGEDVDSP